MSESPDDFRILSPIRGIAVIAAGRSVRMTGFLREKYGNGRWRKMKGIARIEDDYGYIGNAEIHWYEAHGVGKCEIKIKYRPK